MAGIILLTAMAAGGISLWLKRRKLENQIDFEIQDDTFTTGKLPDADTSANKESQNP